ncbi:hypothetical protein D3OALGB2SA_3518 [Olavius algarvensis associated proteobacterium Delta 3]|nr:hypothetical protein D3OALGB2SA_3518 [Olavius algarvensis associated proteobacterium Delta 3]
MQELAITSGAVDPYFRQRLEKAHRNLYNRFISEIDSLINDGKCLTIEASTDTRDREAQKVFSE